MLGEFHIFLRTHLFYELQGAESYPGTVFPVILQLRAHPVGIQIQCRCEGESVECGDLLWGHHDVVADAVPYKNLSVPVVDYASGRINSVTDHGVVLRGLLIGIVDYLDCEKPHQQHGNHHP